MSEGVIRDLSPAFERRHIGPDSEEISTMLGVIGRESLAELIDEAVPQAIRMGGNTGPSRKAIRSGSFGGFERSYE